MEKLRKILASKLSLSRLDFAIIAIVIIVLGAIGLEQAGQISDQSAKIEKLEKQVTSLTAEVADGVTKANNLGSSLSDEKQLHDGCWKQSTLYRLALGSYLDWTQDVFSAMSGNRSADPSNNNPSYKAAMEFINGAKAINCEAASE